MHYSGSLEVHWAGWKIVPQNLKKKKHNNKLVSLSFWLFQTKIYFREPYRQNYQTGNCFLPKDIFESQQKISQQFKPSLGKQQR